ncbi:hypothetical protein [Rasiella sp. SM2506]|uniref:hypothetical protein n=1 Tax=Rasiella sp. SM2506 TaxID=3423914 RepID=UPI003D78E5F5
MGRIKKYGEFIVENIEERKPTLKLIKDILNKYYIDNIEKYSKKLEGEIVFGNGENCCYFISLEWSNTFGSWKLEWEYYYNGNKEHDSQPLYMLMESELKSLYKLIIRVLSDYENIIKKINQS